METNWYKIINKPEWESLDLVQQEIVVDLEDIGERTILVTKGNYLSFLYDEVLLTLNMNGENPFAFGEDYLIYLDEDDDVWLGINQHET